MKKLLLLAVIFCSVSVSAQTKNRFVDSVKIVKLNAMKKQLTELEQEAQRRNKQRQKSDSAYKASATKIKIKTSN
jgi:hypothetical protein